MPSLLPRVFAASLAVASGLGLAGAQAMPFLYAPQPTVFVPVHDYDGYGDRGYGRRHHHGHHRGWGGRRGWDDDRGHGRRGWGHHHHHDRRGGYGGSNRY